MAGITDWLSDEDYLMLKVAKTAKVDKAAAKSWRIFSKSVLPKSFPLLYQSYKMEIDEKDACGCASSLSDLIKMFPDNLLVTRELRSIIDAVTSGTNNFLSEIFELFSEEIKYDMMINVARNARSVEEHCQLWFFLKRMPSFKILQDGIIVETLLSAEDQSGVHKPINRFRKMLVCDALPLVLRVPQDYKFDVVSKLLQKAVEFYVACLFTQPTAEDLEFRKEVAVLPENPDEGWKILLSLFETVAVRYKWNFPELYASKFNELQQLLSLLKENNSVIATPTNEKHKLGEVSEYEAFFCLVISFFYYLYIFGGLVHPKLFSNVPTGPYNFIAMEGVTFLPNDCPKTILSDFKQTEKGYLVLSKYGTEDGKLLPSAFAIAVKCWEILHRNEHLLKDFKAMCTNVGMESYPVFQEFYVHSAVYEEAPTRCMEYLRSIRNNSLDITHKNKIDMQIASCFYCMKDYQSSLNILFAIIANLQSVQDANPIKSCVPKFPDRYIYFMAYNNSDILQYGISVLLKIYKSMDKIDDTCKDMALGNMLVLMQYNLENEYRMLEGCLEAIKKAKSFSFPKFFKYIIHIDILEEISHLSTPAGGNVYLDILQTPRVQTSKHGARGVKEPREELKQAFINQMARCYDNLDNLLIEFFKAERIRLLIPLRNYL